MKPGNDPSAGGGEAAGARFRFDGIVVDAAAHTLIRDGREQALEPKAFAVLLALLRRPGELQGRDDLLDQVWGHRHVTPGVLTRAIAQLRAALDDDSQRPRYIQTQHALGYRFIGRLESDADEPGEAAVVAAAADGDDDAGGEAHAGPGEAQSAMPSADAAFVPAPAAAPAPASAAVPENAPAPGFLRRMGGIALPTLLAVLVGTWIWRGDSPPAAPVEASIAVLPFTTLSDRREDRYFAEGLSVEMLNALSGVHGMKVAAWRPPEAIDRSQDVQALGRLLGVATVLDASVRRDGDRLRISARLSDTRSGYTLWSRNYDGDADSIFDTQADIADAVASALLDVVPEERESLRRRLAPTRNTMAFDAYLLGLKQLVHPQGEGAAAEAAQHFRAALEADAGFARAQAGLCRWELWNFESNHNTDAFENARLACLRAMKMDRTMGEVNLALGDLYRVQGDAAQARKYYEAIIDDPEMRWQALVGRAKLSLDQGSEDDAMRDFRLALEDSPGNAQVHGELGYQQYRLGHYREAIDAYRTVVALRPDSSVAWSILAGMLVAAGDDEGAEAALRRSLAIEPNEASLSNLGTLRYQKGDYAGAAELYRRANALNPGEFVYLGYLGDALDADPRTVAQAREPYMQAAGLAQRFVDAKPDDAYALAALGWYRAQLGERDAALRLAGQAASLGREPGEVAMLNATTFAVLGLQDRARDALRTAQDSGVPGSRIASNAVLKRTGLANPAAPVSAQEARPITPAPAVSPRGS
jgi:TolB-like protein/DNA-binding winged helix-turn-helix (wHTH) protein/Flp pilus assembly protein TadD